MSNNDDDWNREDNDIFPAAFFVEVKDDLTIKRELLAFESMRTPELHNKYLRMLYRCKDKLEEVKIEHNQILHDVEMLYNKQLPDDVYRELARQVPSPKWLDLTMTKAEIQRYVTNNTQYKNSLRRLHLWQHRVEFLTKVVETINNRSFVINNAVKMIRFENGEN